MGFVGQVGEDILSGIRTVLAFNAQEVETRRYEAPLFEGYRSGVHKARDFSFLRCWAKSGFQVLLISAFSSVSSLLFSLQTESPSCK